MAESPAAGHRSTVVRGDRYRIGKSFTFEASHCLPQHSALRRCTHEHGHSYTVGVVLVSDTLIGPGFVTDFADLDPFKHYLLDTFDHRRLNDVLDGEPTRETIEHHLTCWLTDHLTPRIHGRLETVRVSDSSGIVPWAGRMYRFAASHHLSGLPAGHKCAREHGHSYTVGVALAHDAAVPAGFVGDCGGLDAFGEYVAGLSGNLNDALDIEPTSERIAEHLAGWFTAHIQARIADPLRSVWVSETATTWASYAPSGVGL